MDPFLRITFMIIVIFTVLLIISLLLERRHAIDMGALDRELQDFVKGLNDVPSQA